jgi:hypothetical protein
MQEFKELPILDVQDYKNINMESEKLFARDLQDPKTNSEFSNYMLMAQIVMKLDHLRSYVPKKNKDNQMMRMARPTSSVTQETGMPTKDTSSTASQSKQ